MEDVCEGKNYSFPKQEEEILKLWHEISAFENQLKRTENMPEFVFYDGPPFATGLPHYGHILAGTIKDIVTRYKSMTGHHVMRRFGWDCHGLPVEQEMDKKFHLKKKADVLKMGIGNYNEECRSIVTRFVSQWEDTVTRMGRWIDFRNDYKTMDLNYMETLWWVFSQLYDKGLIYRAFKVTPYSTGCKTTLSNVEANQNYKDVSDPAIMVSFPLVGDPDDASLVAWTTTPWTLPSNLCLCVNPAFDYVKLRHKVSGSVYMVAKSRRSQLPTNISKSKKSDTFQNHSKATPNEKHQIDGLSEPYELLDVFSGASLLGKKYIPLFDYFSEFYEAGFRIVGDSCVTDDSGTGVVHFAPAFGEDDYRVCIENHIIDKGEALVVAVDEDGCFTEKIYDFGGLYVKDADKDIINAVKAKSRLVKYQTIMHSYPFCWRSETPLIYRAVPSWFVAVEKVKQQLLENNKLTYWVPDFAKANRFHKWLENARDWAVSRTRFWGTPLPVWVSEDGEERVVMDSIQKLEKLSGVKVTDLHRHKIDHITIPSSRGPNHGVLRRVEDVFDCWFESGSMPYAYIHYPFENVELFENNFPGDFVAEGLDQTRGWFYYLMVLSTALFGKPAFRNLICNGLVLDSHGKKMSKSLRNYPPPKEILDSYGADALRLYLIKSPVVRAEPLRFKEDGVYNVVKDVFLPWYNAYRFLVQNAKRLEVEGLAPFAPADQVALETSSNVLDRWINSTTEGLIHFIRQEMDAYRLYTVVPYVLKFIDNLTNIYVRFNRKRLKGRTGEEDWRRALATLYHVLVTTCKVMAPFTPFFTEVMYQNMRKVDNGSEESIHYCNFPKEGGKRHARIEKSVSWMMSIIDLGRNIRDRRKKPLKMPLKEMIVVHPDTDFLEDIAGILREHVVEELNVQSLVTCNDPSKYTTMHAKPIYRVLGKRLGGAMRDVGKMVEDMLPEDILRLERDGEIDIAGHCLKLCEIEIVREFKRFENAGEDEIDVAGDGNVWVILDLRPDKSLFDAGIAREFVNRVQKMRKNSSLEPTDVVEVYVESLADDKSILNQVLEEQECYIRNALGSSVLPFSLAPAHTVVLYEESFRGILGMDFVVVRLARPALVFNTDAILLLYSGNAELAEGLQTYLSSMDHSVLESQFQLGNGQIRVDCFADMPAVDVLLGRHLYLTVGDYYVSTSGGFL